MLKKHWKRYTGLLVGLVILVAGYALWYQHRMEQLNADPVKVFVLPEGYTPPDSSADTASEPKAETAKSDTAQGNARKPALSHGSPAPRPSEGDTAQGGHWHDGEWHAEAHEGSPVQYTAPPGAVTAPVFPAVDSNEDPVKAAYKRLEYIKNNPYAWGGVHSPRATELIAQLMPPRLPRDHGDSDARESLIEALCEQGDPRAAEALIALMCDGGTKGRVMFDTLEEIGPPAVPYILPYLQREKTYGSDWIYVSFAVFDPLIRIGVRYRDALGGILDHILIPKFEEIAADEDYERYHYATVRNARAALARLQ